MSKCKKLFNLLLISILTLGLASCAQSAADESNNPPSPGKGSGSGYIGSKVPGSTFQVGDILFNDGSATPYSEISVRATKECTQDEKSAAIAVIYKAATTTTPAYGVGIKQAVKKWCSSEAQAFHQLITYIDENDTDGSDNLQQIAYFLDTEGKNLHAREPATVNDTGITLAPTGTGYEGTVSEKYPAFKFAYEYGITENHNFATLFTDNWYLPTSSELTDLFNSDANNNNIEKIWDIYYKTNFYARAIRTF